MFCMNINSKIEKIKKLFPELVFNSYESCLGKNKDIFILDKKVVFVFPKSIDIVDSVKKESNMASHLSLGVTLSISKFKYIEESEGIFGYDYIPGGCLSAETLKGLTLDERDIVANQLSIFLNELHSFPLPISRRCGVVQSISEKEELDSMGAKVGVIKKKLKENDLVFVSNLLEVFRNEWKENFKFVLSHGRFNGEHILIHNNSISGIINFRNLKISDPAIDIAQLWEYGEDFVDSVLHGYFLNSAELKKRSLKWYFYECIDDMYLAIMNRDEDLFQKSYDKFTKTRDIKNTP